jgi:hypothetical protein
MVSGRKILFIPTRPFRKSIKPNENKGKSMVGMLVGMLVGIPHWKGLQNSVAVPLTNTEWVKTSKVSEN